MVIRLHMQDEVDLVDKAGVVNAMHDASTGDTAGRGKDHMDRFRYKQQSMHQCHCSHPFSLCL